MRTRTCYGTRAETLFFGKLISPRHRPCPSCVFFVFVVLATFFAIFFLAFFANFIVSDCTDGCIASAQSATRNCTMIKITKYRKVTAVYSSQSSIVSCAFVSTTWWSHRPSTGSGDPFGLESSALILNDTN